MVRRSTLILLTVVVIGAITLTLVPTSRIGNRDPHEEFSINYDAAFGILDLFDKLISTNPDYESVRPRLAALSWDTAQAKLTELRERNQANPELTQVLSELDQTEAYQLYYRQFRNVTPEVHRNVMLTLPFGSIMSPGDISVNLLDAMDHSSALRQMLEQIRGELAIGRSIEIARAWLPERSYAPPKVHFIIDGNGDAFARGDAIVMDLWGLVLVRREREQRYTDLTAAEISTLQETLAHELHHHYARQCRKSDPSTTFDRITHSIVSEGLAMHCNPPAGLKLAVMTDTAIVGYWLTELAKHRRNFDTDALQANEFSCWADSTYQDIAHEKLVEYLSRSYSGDYLHKQVDLHIIDRPAMVYTLGWWMVESITRQGADRSAAIRLVSEPDSVYVWYNRSVKETAPAMSFGS